MFSNKIFKISLLISVFLFVGGNVFGATFDNFDSYNDGNLNSQGGWVGDVGFQVQATTTQQGLKAVYIASGVGGGIAKTIGLSNGRIIGWIRGNPPTTTDSIALGVSDVGPYSPLAEVYFKSTGNIDFYGETEETILTDYVPDTWYRAEIQWRNSDLKMRARIDNGTWSSWIGTQDCCPSEWTKVEYVSFLNNEGGGYFDSITYNLSYIVISSEFSTSTLAYAGQLFTDLSIPIILIIGLPLGFWVIKKIISLVRAR